MRKRGGDIILLRLFGNEQHEVYVDVGAHHPYRFSNTSALYQRGINIDADPAAIEAFQRDRPRDINLSLGVLEKCSFQGSDNWIRYLYSLAE